MDSERYRRRNTASRSASGMPGPLSVTRRPGPSGKTRTVIWIRLLSGENLMALSSRLQAASNSIWASPDMTAGDGEGSNVRVMPRSSARGSKNSAASAPIRLRSTLAQFPALGALQACNQAGQGRTQIVGDIVTDAFDLAHQPLQFIKHAVDHIGQAVDIVQVAPGRQAPAEVALDDAFDRGAQSVEPASGRIAHGDRTQQADHQQQAAAGHQRMDQQFIELANVMHVLGGDQDFTVIEAMRHEAYGSCIATGLFPAKLIGLFVLQVRRHRLDHPGNMLALGTEKSLRPASLGVMELVANDFLFAQQGRLQPAVVDLPMQARVGLDRKST